ncbi:hypothetical protein EJ02DRAFT_206512 [Clathrospora elynae]|uniref:Uncharacterized protein n=1 Tax=Clathrospora elynae TaxID=706981 RepID=A0A6A5SNG8_9PLEO|nr:hypothetical protein EJ02DRAFT_206512 [Clathrospora elynae]
MCYTEHVFHRPCCHWGRQRFAGEPCCRARIVNGYHLPCLYSENNGSVNSDELCFVCKYRIAHGKDCRPLSIISTSVHSSGIGRAESKTYCSEPLHAS